MNTTNGSTSKSLNADRLSNELYDTLAEAARSLKTISANLGALIEAQVTNPESAEPDGDVAAERLLDWTADIFAISEDIDFYINPAPKGN